MTLRYGTVKQRERKSVSFLWRSVDKSFYQKCNKTNYPHFGFSF